MNLGLNDKVAVVLSASGGIGLGIAKALAAEGCDMAICARNDDRLQVAARNIRDESGRKVFAYAADVSQVESLDSFLDAVLNEYGKVDILINNTGGPPPGACLDFSDTDYQKAFELVLMSKVRACRKLVPIMAEHGFGRILNIESTSLKCALENMVMSNVFRSASAAFSKTLSMEYAKKGIRVHTLMSGPFMTNRVQELGGAAAEKKGISFDQWKAEAETNTPLGRFGNPDEFGALAAFLSSSKADYLNGTCIAIDGGVLKTVT